MHNTSRILVILIYQLVVLILASTLVRARSTLWYVVCVLCIETTPPYIIYVCICTLPLATPTYAYFQSSMYTLECGYYSSSTYQYSRVLYDVHTYIQHHERVLASMHTVCIEQLASQLVNHLWRMGGKYCTRVCIHNALIGNETHSCRGRRPAGASAGYAVAALHHFTLDQRVCTI